MSKRLLGISLAAALISAAAYLYVQASRDEPQTADTLIDENTSTSSVANQGKQERGLSAKRLGDGNTPLISAAVSPERAYADAFAILRCTHASNSDLSLPEGVTFEAKKQFEESRVDGLDCSALDNQHSAYDLAKFAAESGNLQAQLDFSAIAASEFNEEKNALNPELVAQYKWDSLKFLNMAAAAGNSDAYARLAANYQTGLFSDKDKIKAYAYAYAYLNSQSNQSDMSKRWINQFMRGLSVDELLQAQQLGQSLISRKR